MTPYAKKIAGFFVFFIVLICIFPVSKYLCDTSENGAQAVMRTVTDEGAQAVIANGQLCKSSECVEALLFHGGISAQSMQRLRQALDARRDVRWVCLESGGGVSSDGLDMAKELRQRHIGTCVVPREAGLPNRVSALCASACVELWLGGAERILAPQGVTLGVHNSYIAPAPYCLVGNCIQRRIRSIQVWHTGLTLGDASARNELWRKAGQCGPNEVYSIQAIEALRLKLVNEGQGSGNWYWRPVGPNEQFPALPHATPCVAT